MPAFAITVNGTLHEIHAAPQTPLLYVLRNDLQLNGPKFGCGLAQCGACTVHLGRSATRSCITPIFSVGDAAVLTLEGLGTPDRLHPLQKTFIEEQAAQCGYCINGMIMQAVAFLESNPDPDERQVRSALAGNLCRCGTHLRIVRAIMRAATMMRESNP